MKTKELTIFSALNAFMSQMKDKLNEHQEKYTELRSYSLYDKMNIKLRS